MKPVDPIAGKVGHHLRRCSSMFASDLMRRTKTVGLKPTEAATLFVIAANPGRSQVTTGRILDVRRANLVPHIAKLLDLGLIRCEPGKGKVITVTATPKGLKKAAVIGRLMDEHEERFQSRLTASEVEELLRLLIKLRGDAPVE